MSSDPELDAALFEALDALRRDPRVRYAEVRFTDEISEEVKVRMTRGAPRFDTVSTNRSRGVGIRALGARTWGFACTPRLDAGSVREAALRAAAIADASSRFAARAVPFPERAPSRGSWSSPVKQDPFAVPMDERLAALEAPLAILLEGAASPVRSAEAHMEFRRLDKRLLTTEGTDVTQSAVEGACNMQAIGVDDSSKPASRTFPTFTGGDAFQAGYERIAGLDLPSRAREMKAELAELLRAPSLAAGELDVILESSQLALQIHESCGHPTELDRALGTEITLAGGSFLDPGKLGTFRYGSDAVTMTAGSTAEGGVGTFGWDDEGTPAGEHVLVDRGILTDFLSSRETAAGIGRASTGTMRASGWDRVPLIRMTNVSLAPGSAGTLEDLVADTKDGVLIATNKSWSIDDQRLDFQFSCEIGWRIRDGKRAEMIRAPLYGGSTPRFWGSCDAVCGPSEHRLWGVSSCGKGDPIQIVSVGHGAAPARFRRVRVGSAS
jgi:TldD protein